MQYEAPLLLDRAAAVHRLLQVTTVHIQLLQDFSQGHVQWLVDQQAKGTVGIMIAEIDNTAVEIGISKPGRCHQELPLEILGLLLAFTHPDVSPRR